MDSKSDTQSNNGVKNRDDLAKLSSKSKINDANTASKQMPASNSAEPKQRVIKQIVSLDAKKLKALGIESNILSALTKFNGKDKASIKTKPTVKNTQSTTSTTSTELPVQESTITAAVSSQKKPDETSPAKKIQVLSDVLLSENKLDLNIFPVIASSSTPVSSKHISYVSQVTRPSQIKHPDADKVPSSQVISPIVVHEESVKLSNVEENETLDKIKSSESPVKSPIKSILVQKLSPVKTPVKFSTVNSTLPAKKLGKSPIKLPDSETSSQTSEVDSLKGFSLPELKSSQNQFEMLQNEIYPKPSKISTVKIERDKETENVEENLKTETTNEMSTEQSNTFTTSETVSSDQSSDSESDLDELILEAQITIENERQQDEDTDETTESPELKIPTKKPRLVQKKFLDMLTEHVDKDRLIDEFLESTNNSFRTGYDSPSDSESSDDHVDADVIVDVDMDIDSEPTVQVNDYETDCVGSGVEVTEEASVEASSKTTSTDNDKLMEEPIHKAVPADENVSAIEPVKSETIEVTESLLQPESRKRKISTKSEISSRQKKSKSINSYESESNAVQTQQIPMEPVDEPQAVETLKEVKDVESSSIVAVPEQQVLVSTHTQHTQSVVAKRGRKPKQSILNDYFAVQNSRLNATKQSLDEVINNTSTMKSSRYGRVIKPKSFDIETKTKPKRKTRKELTNEREQEPEPMLLPEIEIEIKQESIAPKPLKKRRDKKGDYVIPPDDIPSIDTLSESIIEPIDHSTVLANTEAEPSFICSFDPISSRRKLLKQNKISAIDKIPESPNNDNMSIDVNTPKVVHKRKGRPPKKSINYNETANEIPLISIDCDKISSFKQEKFENTETPTTNIPMKKRGRRPKNAMIEDETQNENVSSYNVPIESQEDDFKTPTEANVRRRGRTPKSVTIEETPPSTSESILSADDTVSIDDSHSTTPTPKKRGRPRITPKPLEEEASAIKYTCGNCQAEIPVNRWKAHVATHFGVTFRVGIDDPFDVEDVSNIGRIMIRFMKLNKIQYLKCPKCGERKKSALGYISHVELCGLSAEQVASLKAECEYCKKLYRKVSIASHQQTFCPVRRLELAQQQADQIVQTAAEDEPNIEVVYSECGRPKRMIKKVKPTSKPIDDFIKVGLKITGGTYKGWTNHLYDYGIIKCTNYSCTFSAADVNEMRKHFIQCRESILQCKICLHTERSRDAIIQHIETLHPDELKIDETDEEDNDDDDDDFKATNQSSDSSDFESGDDEFAELQKPNKSVKRKRSVPLKRIMEEDSPAYWEMLSAFYTRILNTRPGFHRKSYQWTKEFVEQNYDLNALTLSGHMRSTFEIVRLPQREVNKFLGLLHSKSEQFLCQKQNEYQREKSEITDETWNNLNLFESTKSTHINTESSIIFCGGKIVTADWIPFPTSYNGTQILAICSQGQDTKPISTMNRIPMEKCRSLIQLWSVSTNADAKIDKTEFMYGIAYESGPICSISFCPSDAYVASKRLAIVALPDTIGNINIISIPDNVSRAKTNTPTVIKLKPEIRLQLGLNKDENPPQTVTEIVWSRTKGHKVLCAGYNTGLIAIWNFEHLNSTYLVHKGASDGIPILLPQYSFMGSLSFITQLDLHADDDGNARWVLVGALDRRIRLYDLLDPQLIPFTSPIFKSRIISGTWPLHWPIYLTIIDAVLTRQNGGLHLKPVLYTNYTSCNANLFNDCEPSNLAFSDWLNTGIFGNEVGDLFMINFQQLLVHDRYDESSEQKVLSCTDVFVDEESSNDNSNNRIKIVFKDFDKKVLSPKLNTRSPAVDQHPYARITRVAINPNESHQKLYAIGYELGFCRIHFIPETIG